MRNHTCANLRSVVAASDETPVRVTRHTAGASRAGAHVPARGAPRPAAPRVWPVSRRATLWHALSHVYPRSHSLPGAAGGAARHTQRSRKLAAVLRPLPSSAATSCWPRAHESRRAPPIELSPAARKRHTNARRRSAGRPSSPRQRRRRRHLRPGVRSPNPPRREAARR